MQKIETRFQEMLFVLLLIGSPIVFFGCFFYLFMDKAQLAVWLGASGSDFVQLLYNYVGFATFLLPVYFVETIVSTIKRYDSLMLVLKSYRSFLVKFSAQAALMICLASLMGVLQLYLSAETRLPMGFGGSVGLSWGGALYDKFGLMGSLGCIFSTLAVIAIIARWLDLVAVSISTGNLLKKALSYLSYEIRNQSKKLFHAAKSQVSSKKKEQYIDEVELGTSHHVESAYISQEELVANQTEEFFAQVANGPEYSLPGILLDEEPAPQRKRSRAKIREAPAAEIPEEESDEETELSSKKMSRKKKASKKTAASKKEANKPSEEDGESTDENSTGEVEEITLNDVKGKYHKPDKALLKNHKGGKVMGPRELKQKAAFLEERLLSFGVEGKVVKIHPGIRLTMYEVQPSSGVKLSKIQALTSDLALLLGAPSIRILAPIPNKTTVGIEIPNEETGVLGFKDCIAPLNKAAKKMKLPIVVGKDVYNQFQVQDLAAMPHLLISGTTGSGKSVFMNSLITSLLYTRSPKELRMIMVDPKMIELTPYNAAPHLVKPVISDVLEAKDALVWAMQEMDLRYQIFSDVGARNIESFNEKIIDASKSSLEKRKGKQFDWSWKHMPYLVIVIDELADLMITQGKEVEIPITRIAQKARACGIHLVLATQRPSSDIVTGLIKTNFPTRIAFKVSSGIDSRTILDQSGAEKLLGNGDMLFLPNGKNIERVQGAFLSEKEVNAVVKSIDKN